MRSLEITMKLIVVAFAIAIQSVVVCTDRVTGDGPLVNTPVGSIRGVWAEDGTAMYLGIPYATVDEKNPFGPSRPNPPFQGVFNAIDDSARCPQSGGVSSLDCLHINVHVPKNAGTKPLPVLVNIYGGRFMFGESGRRTHGPKFITRHDVIFVSLNYRVSAYGFMCLHTPEVPGNQGLKDQLAALRWVKRNIKAFGGDEDSITLAGNSAGGVSVDLQLLFADEGLLHRAIIQSGTALSSWAFEGPHLDAAIRIANTMGFATNDTNEAVKYLSSQQPGEVLRAAQGIRFQPCVEKAFPNVERFIHVHPVNAPLPQARRIPILTGYTDDERLGTYANLSPSAFERVNVFENNMRVQFEFGDRHEAKKWFVRRFYVGDEPMSVDIRRGVTDFDSDCLFVHPTQRTIAKYLDNNGVVYHYVFTYIGGRNLGRIRSNITEGGGAGHSDEMGYLFDVHDLPNTPTPEDQLIIDRMTTLWTNFAKYGNPTPSVTEQLPVQWLPVTRERLNYLNITTDIQMGIRPFHQRLTFWDMFYHSNWEYIRGYAK